MPCSQRCVTVRAHNWHCIISGTFNQCSSRRIVELCVPVSSQRTVTERRHSEQTTAVDSATRTHHSQSQYWTTKSSFVMTSARSIAPAAKLYHLMRSHHHHHHQFICQIGEHNKKIVGLQFD